ncbi:MAG: hypothetical protein EXR14_02155 [Pelagibacteraceae bacterium]|nr:hypothetical protein [Pelagibacteraceae bacterium]PHX89340.1 MAG: hypothetical protein CK535_01885 [Pelagibacteraceae bacterium]
MNNLETEIIKSKKILRNKSNDYKKKFERISDFIKSEVIEIKKFKEKNLSYAKKQAKKFLKGESLSDFALEDYEVSYKNKTLINDLSDLGKKQMTLKEWL